MGESSGIQKFLETTFTDITGKASATSIATTAFTTLLGGYLGSESGTTGLLLGSIGGLLGGTFLSSLITGFRSEKDSRVMPLPAAVTAQQVTERALVQNVAPTTPTAAPLTGPAQAPVVMPILERLKPPSVSLSGVAADRITLLNNIRTLATRSQWEEASRRMLENETKASQFMVNFAAYIQDRTAYHAPKGERSQLIAITGDVSRVAGRHPLTHQLANLFVPTLPGLQNLDGALTSSDGSKIPYEQAVADYENNRGIFALPPAVADYARVKYMGDTTGIRDKANSIIAWENLSTDQRVNYAQRILVAELNTLGNGNFKIPADLKLEEITKFSHPPTVSTLRQQLRSKGVFESDYTIGLSHDTFFANYLQAALEEKNYGQLAWTAGQARTRYNTGGSLGFTKDTAKAAHYGAIEEYAQKMDKLQELQTGLVRFIKNRQSLIYDIYENMGKKTIAPARRDATLFLNQHMPVFKDSGLAIMDVTALTDAAHCPEGASKGTAITFVDTRRPGNILCTAFGTQQGEKFVITHCWEGALDATDMHGSPMLKESAKTKLLTPVTVDASAIAQLTLPEGQTEAAPLRPTPSGKSVGQSLAGPLADIPVYKADTSGFLTKANETAIRLQSVMDYPDALGAPPALPAGRTKDHLTIITYTDPQRGGSNINILGYENEKGEVVATHSWEGTLSGTGENGVVPSWAQVALKDPLNIGASIKVQTLSGLPFFRANQTWDSGAKTIASATPAMRFSTGGPTLNTNPHKAQPFPSTHMMEITDTQTPYKGQIIVHGTHDAAANLFTTVGYELRPAGIPATSAGRYISVATTLNTAAQSGFAPLAESLAREKDLPFIPVPAPVTQAPAYTPPREKPQRSVPAKLQ